MRSGRTDGKHHRQQIEVAPAAPQRPHAGHAVGFSPEMAAETTDPERRLFDRGGRCARGGTLAMNVSPQRPPLFVGQNHSAWRFGLQARPFAQLENSQGDRRVERHDFRKTIGGLELQFFNPAAALENEKEFLDLPAQFVDANDLKRVGQRLDRLGRPEQPAQRRGALRGVDFQDFDEVQLDTTRMIAAIAWGRQREFAGARFDGGASLCLPLFAWDIEVEDAEQKRVADRVVAPI